MRLHRTRGSAVLCPSAGSGFITPHETRPSGNAAAAFRWRRELGNLKREAPGMFTRSSRCMRPATFSWSSAISEIPRG